MSADLGSIKDTGSTEVDVSLNKRATSTLATSKHWGGRSARPLNGSPSALYSWQNCADGADAPPLSLSS